MYPSLYYAIKDLFGLDWPLFKMFQSFGFFVALAFIVSAYLWTKELKRKEQEGLLQASSVKVLKGQKTTPAEYLLSALIGFLLGYKILFIAFHFKEFTENTQGYLLSAQGSWIGGLAGLVISVYFKYREKEKTKLDKPEWVEEKIHPYQHVGNLTLIAAFAGIIGAKIFHNLENWDRFIEDPVGALLSFDGLTMYGGLILASIACIYYGRKNKIPIPHLIDSAAPSLMIGYAIGRIGCHVAGDGDWGILNSAYVSDTAGHSIPATTEQFNSALQLNQDFYAQSYTNIEEVHHMSVKGLANLPDWLFAYTYPHNVINEGIPIAGCVGKYCNYLPLPVFPTAFYEMIMCFILFLVIWKIRKRITTPGVLFSVYLIFNGIERFFIEKIRVNTLYHIGNFAFTQAELISSLLFISGVIGVWYFKRQKLSTKY